MAHSFRHCGIVSYGNDNNLEYLPLEELRARVQILDVSAKVTLTQLFSNSSNLPTRRAKYLFPVPAGAAITTFELSVSDGTRLIGQCMDKDRAAQEFQQAVVSGRSAGLLDYVTDDTFIISVGSIPSGETAETKLTYVMSLQNSDIVNSLEFSLPTYVGERYGTPPPETIDAAQPDASKTRIRVTVEIQTSGSIRSIRTPHYDEYVTINRTHQDGRLSQRRAVIKLKSRKYLHRAFKVICEAEKLAKPRCFAEVLENADGGHTLALQFTLIPKYDLPSIPNQEYILVIDRSGSMSGSPMEQAKKTASLLLHTLPSKGTWFNIFIFDDSVDHWSAQSRLYNHDSLQEAERFINGVNARGGTEIASALSAALSSRKTDMPSTVLVLTDGQATDIARTRSVVSQAVGQASPKARLQVSTLAIGMLVSTDMCETIARAGNGVALSAPTSQGIIGQSRRLLHAGKALFVADVSVDWGIPSHHIARISSVISTTSSSRRRSMAQSSSHGADTPPISTSDQLPVRLQSPPHIPTLHAESRIYIYALISLRRPFVPRLARISGKLINSIATGNHSDAPSEFRLEIPVRSANMTDQGQLHSLAAWRIIQDYQDGIGVRPPHDSKGDAPSKSAPSSPATHNIGGGAHQDEENKKIILQLGEKYQIASKYTSFVAVDPDYRRAQRGRRGDAATWGNRVNNAFGGRRGATTTGATMTSGSGSGGGSSRRSSISPAPQLTLPTMSGIIGAIQSLFYSTLGFAGVGGPPHSPPSSPLPSSSRAPLPLPPPLFSSTSRSQHQSNSTMRGPRGGGRDRNSFGGSGIPPGGYPRGGSLAVSRDQSVSGSSGVGAGGSGSGGDGGNTNPSSMFDVILDDDIYDAGVDEDRNFDVDEDDDDEASGDTYSTMSSLNDDSDEYWSEWSEEAENPAPTRRRRGRGQDHQEHRLSRIEQFRIRSPSPPFVPVPPGDLVTQGESAEYAMGIDGIEGAFLEDGGGPPPPLTSQLSTSSTHSPTVDSQVYDILQEADYDGSFTLDVARQYVGADAIAGGGESDGDDAWATALCVAYLLKKIGAGDAEEFLTKSLEYLDSKGDGVKRRLLEKAKKILM